MRLLLASTASYVPPRGGSTRSNLIWLDHLASRGHDCRVVAGAAARSTTQQRERVRAEVEGEHVHVEFLPGDGREDVELVRRGLLTVASVEQPGRHPAVLREEIETHRPDWVLVSSEDVGQRLLRAAYEAAPGRVVYLAHTPQWFPFGPASWSPNPEATDMVRHGAVVAIGHHTAAYIRRHSGAEVGVVPPPIYGDGPWPRLGTFGQGAVTMINPCAVKGVAIFAELARRFPALPFLALAGWGTTTEDRRLLGSLPNVTVRANVPDIEDVLRETQVLLMPSLWMEGFGLVVMEAMLRGLPVVSSDSGGLVEAKQNTGYVVPVQPIEQYEDTFDEVNMPRPVITTQDLSPWEQALGSLLGSRPLYEEEAEASRQAAERFVAGLDAGQMETFLLSLRPRESAPVTHHPVEDAMQRLSPEKRALLLQRLRK